MRGEVVSVFEDGWLGRLSIGDRLVLLALYSEMRGSRREVYIPFMRYLGNLSLMKSYVSLHKHLASLESMGYIKVFKEVKGEMLIEMAVKGRVVKVPKVYTLLDDRWSRVLMTLFYVMKGDRERLITRAGIIAQKLCSNNNTIYKALNHLEDQGLILRRNRRWHLEITLLI